MMKLVIASCLVAAVLALPVAQGPNEPVAILAQENIASVEGAYKYSYESADGTKVEQEGRLLPAEDKDETPAVGSSGSYSFTGTDGVNYVVSYIADKEGYKPQGAHLPVAPEIPEAIARSLEYNAAHPEQNPQ